MTSSLRDALHQSGALDQFKPVGGREVQTDDRPRRGSPDRRDDRRGAKPNAPANARPANARPANARSDKARLDNARPGQAARQRPVERQRSSEEIDLAKAYALRAQSEQRERERKEKAEREIAERRRAQREQVIALLDGATRNREDAEIPRHFEYGGKIRRVYVNDEQLGQVNDGRLGVIQVRGRYLLVDRELAESIRVVDAHAIALLVDPDDLRDAGDDLVIPAATTV